MILRLANLATASRRLESGKAPNSVSLSSVKNSAAEKTCLSTETTSFSPILGVQAKKVVTTDKLNIRTKSLYRLILIHHSSTLIIFLNNEPSHGVSRPCESPSSPDSHQRISAEDKKKAAEKPPFFIKLTDEDDVTSTVPSSWWLCSHRHRFCTYRDRRPEPDRYHPFRSR